MQRKPLRSVSTFVRKVYRRVTSITRGGSITRKVHPEPAKELWTTPQPRRVLTAGNLFVYDEISSARVDWRVTEMVVKWIMAGSVPSLKHGSVESRKRRTRMNEVSMLARELSVACSAGACLVRCRSHAMSGTDRAHAGRDILDENEGRGALCLRARSAIPSTDTTHAAPRHVPVRRARLVLLPLRLCDAMRGSDVASCSRAGSCASQGCFSLARSR